VRTDAGTDLLDTITAAARQIARVREQARSYADLEAAARRQTPRGAAFRAALSATTGPRIIAECKRRSPSRGVLRRVYDPAAIAASYEAAGAAAVSVLTEPAFFDGDVEHLRAARARVSLPLLRKDFVVSPYQVLEAREMGADATLLIAGALEGPALAELVACVAELGLGALVEVHDEDELERALSAGATIVGVNSRDLRTLRVDLDVARRLAPRLPAGVIGVAESGLRSREEIEELAGLGYRAFLIGERFMTAADPGEALASFLGVTPGDAGRGRA